MEISLIGIGYAGQHHGAVVQIAAGTVAAIVADTDRASHHGHVVAMARHGAFLPARPGLLVDKALLQQQLRASETLLSGALAQVEN